ncbi:transglutaminase [Bifidobacterium hapali]|uniref:Transglutaminase n=2 Tax=Bifidobacterium hapali TaxID=1630172 RepID=A0A261FUD8_9BIFI|nr:transglutaminase [Bifidobacterium hapali]
MSNTADSNVHQRRLPQLSTTVRGSIIAIVITLLSASNLIDVYGSFFISWLCTAIPATLCGVLAARMMKQATAWAAIITLIISQFMIGPLITYDGIAVGHLPTLTSLVLGWRAIFDSFSYVVALSSPVGTDNGGFMALWTICLWSSMLMRWCLWHVMTPAAPTGAPYNTNIHSSVHHTSQQLLQWRHAVAFIIVVLSSFAICAALGTSSGYYRVTAAISAISIMAWQWLTTTEQTNNQYQHHVRKIIRAIITLLVAAAVTCIICQTIPSHRFVLREYYDPPVSLRDYASPLSGMRAYRKRYANDTIMTVTGLPHGTPIRIAVMDVFDGQVWNVSGEEAHTSHGEYRRIGSGTTLPTSDTHDETAIPFSARFTIGANFGDIWLPVAGDVSSIALETIETHASRDTDWLRSQTPAVFHHADAEAALILPGIQQDLSYTVSGILHPQPDEQQINNAAADTITSPEPLAMPESLTSLAIATAAGQKPTGQTAQLLATVLHEHGWLSHGAQGEYPSPPGHSSYRLDAMMSADLMVGDDEQYASAMALMARQVGLPARVVLGLLPSDSDRTAIMPYNSEKASSEAVQNTVMTFTGEHIAAWVEIKLEGLGWVMFDPTPDESRTAVAGMSVVPDSTPIIRQPSLPLIDPLRDHAQLHDRSTVGGTNAEPPVEPTAQHRFAHIATKALWYGSPIWLMTLYCILVIAIKRTVLMIIRCRGSPRHRVLAGWDVLIVQALPCTMATRLCSGTLTRHEQVSAIIKYGDIPISLSPLSHSSMSARLLQCFRNHSKHRAQTSHLSDQHTTEFTIMLRSMADQADQAMYSSIAPDAYQAESYWLNVKQLSQQMLASLPLMQRWRARLSLRGVLSIIRQHATELPS